MMHDDQLSIDVETVRALVADQFPAWRSLPVRAIASAGTVNALFRLGVGLVARFPLRSGDPAEVRRSLEGQADATRAVFGRTPFRTPEPLAIGRPGRGFPLAWSVQTWVPGTTATEANAGGSHDLAHDLARFIRAVRAIGTGGRSFSGPGRGGDLSSHDDWVATCLARSEGLLDVPLLRKMWAAFRELPRGDDPDVMSHGDLVLGNVLVDNGRLVGVIDLDGAGPADPSLDLVAAWHLLDAGPRWTLRHDLGCSALEWERGRAWAFEQALGLVWYYETSNPTMAALGRSTIGRLIE